MIVDMSQSSRDGVAKSLYLYDNRDFRAGACEGAGELVEAREPADRARPKAEDSAKEREKFDIIRLNIDKSSFLYFQIIWDIYEI